MIQTQKDFEIIKVGDMVITKPEFDYLGDAKITEPTRVIRIIGGQEGYFELEGKKNCYKGVALQKVEKTEKNEIDFTKERQEILPDLYLSVEDSTLCVTTNYDDWYRLQQKEDKLFLSVTSNEEDQELCVGLNMEQVEELEQYLQKFKKVVKELEERKLKKRMTLAEIEKALGYEIELY